MQTRSGFVLDVGFLTGLKNHLAVPDGVAVVGAGRWAKVMCHVLTQFSPPVSHIALVAEHSYAATQRWLDERSRVAGHSGLERVVVNRSLDEVVENDGVDVAFVTKMASDHYAATRQLLLARKHVLVEKPFVLKPAEAETLVRLAKRQGLTLAVGYEFMFARPLHHLREMTESHLTDVREVRFVWEDCAGVEKWGVRKQPDLSANAITDLYPHILSQLVVLFGDQDVSLRSVTSRDGCWKALISFWYGSVSVTAALDKEAAEPRRSILVRSASGSCLTLDYTREPGELDLDGAALPPDRLAKSFPSSLTSEIAYFFAGTRRPVMNLPNSADRTVRFVKSMDQANSELVVRQTEEVRPWFMERRPRVTTGGRRAHPSPSDGGSATPPLDHREPEGHRGS